MSNMHAGDIEAQFNEASAARVLGVSSRTLGAWRRNGAIGYHRTPGGRIFYTLDQLANCRARMRVQPTEM